MITKGSNKKGCCGGKLFNPKTHICCNGYQFKLDKTGVFACCDVKNYDTRNAICCNGKIVYKNQNDAYECRASSGYY